MSTVSVSGGRASASSAQLKGNPELNHHNRGRAAAVHELVVLVHAPTIALLWQSVVLYY